ncbi:MAG: LamG-like jellyroll fold domain-containing protein [Bacteroidota bacterium]
MKNPLHNSKTGNLKLHPKFFFLIMGAFLVGAIPFGIMQTGLDNPTAVGQYINGILPSSGGSSWDVVDAFPNLTFDDPLQMLELEDENAFVIVGKYGQIWSITNADSTTATKNLMLDIGPQVFVGGDCGLLGAVFHPDFGKAASKDYMYIWYRHLYTPQNANDAYIRLCRYDVDPNTLVADPATEFIMISQFDRHQWHNGGGMFFGDDGFLYITVGDEGGADDIYDNGQKIDEGLLSGLLRIDVDMDPSRSHPIRRQPVSPGSPLPSWPNSFSQGYYIPNDNPWQSPDSSNLEEFYAIGLRSPHRSTYDPVSGRIFVGDIGQGSREEISDIEKGDNLQWPYGEGDIAGSKAKPDSLIGTDKPPFYSYARSMGSSVIGGVVYRGSKFPSLQGSYIFGDHTNRKIWSLGILTAEVEYLTEVPASGVGNKSGISSFFADRNGEIYVTKLFGSEGADGGKIYKLVQTAAPESPPALLSSTGVFTNLTSMATEDYVIPYDMTVPFWSDNAKKYRWLIVPNDGTHNSDAEQVTFRKYDAFDWPIGTVFIKHFEYQTDDQDPNSLVKLETRFIVKGSDEKVFGFTYKWNDAQTDAELQTVGYLDTLAIQTALGPREVHWYYPGQQECSFCHNESAGGTLGPKSVQMNMDTYYPQTGRTANQLKTLSHLNIFENEPDTSKLDELPIAVHGDETDQPLEVRVKSYLDMNCAYCHRPNSAIRANFDARFKTPLASMKLIMGELDNNPSNSPENRVVVPGNVDESMLYKRLAAVHDEISMPPLAKNLMDTAGVALIAEWINSMNPSDGVSDLFEGRTTYYDFEDGVIDQVGEADGAMINGASIVNDPERGNVLSTDGIDDYVEVPHSDQLNIGDANEDYTAALWFKLETDHTGSHRTIFNKGDKAHLQTPGMWMDKNSNRIEYKTSVIGNSYAGGESTTEMNLNEWTHLTLVKDDYTLFFYINGVQESIKELDADSKPNTKNMYFGINPGTGGYLDGLYDDFMIYNRALSSEEVAALASDTEDKYQLAHWPFNGDGRDVVNGADAMLMNGPSFINDAERGEVLSLDGSNDFLMSRHRDHLLLGRADKSFSVNLFLNLQEDATGQFRTIVKKGDSNLDATFSMKMNDADNKILFEATTGNGVESGLSSTALVTNRWYNITYSFDGTDVKLFIDGIEDASFTLTSSIEANNGFIFFGDDPSNYPLKAYMDDVKISNKSLSGIDLGKMMLDTKPFVLGNDAYADGNMDAGKANLYINRSDVFTNNLNVPVEIQLEKFRFFANRLGNPLTPFVAKENAGNYQVLKIGSTRESSSYSVGENTFDFKDGGSVSLTVQPGEIIYTGFIDAFPDGSGDGINSVVPYDAVSSNDEVFYTGGLTGGSSASISEGANVVNGDVNSIINRDYRFLIEATVMGSQAKMLQVLDIDELSPVVVTDGSVTLQAASTYGMPIDYSVVSGPATAEGPKINFTGSTGQVVVEAIQNGNNHLVESNKERISFFIRPGGNYDGQGTGLGASYYNDTARSQRIMQRVDSVVDFHWGSIPPDPSMNPQTFSVVWEGEIESPFTETITFHTSTDDGVRLWVNNQLIIDNWTDQSVSSSFGNIAMNAWENVSIKMEYYQNEVYAEAHLSWSSPSMPEEIVPTSFLYPLLTTLPVELADFDVELVGKEANLTWVSTTELNTSHFTIERSTDGLLFQPLGRVEAVGGDNVPTFYDYIDPKPEFGINYYRLKMVDLDGTHTYSDIKSINLNGDVLWAYPNPVKLGEEIKVDMALSNSNSGRLEIYDLSGRSVYRQDVSLTDGKGGIGLDSGILEPGGYLILLIGSKGEKLVRKIMVSK